MGTSKGYGGPPNSLIPSWLASSEDGEAGENGGEGGDDSDSADGTPDVAAGDGGGFAGARTAFT
ncbi:hypothetical protein QMN58_25215, partial [Escherichia coli]|nr:hypothetical protein [Escherichia coli]